MNRKILLTVLVLLVMVMLATSVSTALAVTTNIDQMYAGGNTVIDVLGKTRIRIYAWHMDGDYYSGKADRIQIVVDTGSPPAAPVFKAVAGYEDNPTRHAFSVSLGASMAEYLVKPWQIGILRIGKTSFVYWTVPLVAPATDGTNPTPEVTIPPAVLVLEGHGDLIHISTNKIPFGKFGWTYQVESDVYNAKTTLLCPGWHFCGRVAEAYVGTTLEAKSIKTATWTWEGP